MISIVIPVYNQADKLAACLDSILKQSYGNYEVIIIDDGSTDNIEPVLRKYQNEFGHKMQFVSQENQGANPARNYGAKLAKGEYLLFCDADIELSPDMLSEMSRVLNENKNKSYAYSSFKWGWKTFKLWPFDSKKLEEMPYIHTTSLIRREHFPGFDQNIKRLQDWDLWLTMLEKGYTGIWIDKTLFKVATGGTMSKWLPSFIYKLMPFLPSVRQYNKAVKTIKKKHNL
jgi:glycosyltransferase involved in cell wall biosynthesis